MKKFGKEDICFILVGTYDDSLLAVSRLDQYLRREGYATRSVFFWGEGKPDFSKLTMSECVSNVREIVREATKQYGYVIGIGVSLGASILLDCAKGDTPLSAMVGLGTPFKLRNRKAIKLSIKFIYPLLRAWWRAIGRNSKWLASPEVVRYLDGVFQRDMDKIEIPVLFLQSTRDTVAICRAIENYFPALGTNAKKNVYVPDANHILLGFEEVVLEEFSSFMADNGTV